MKPVLDRLLDNTFWVRYGHGHKRGRPIWVTGTMIQMGHRDNLLIQTDDRRIDPAGWGWPMAAYRNELLLWICGEIKKAAQ